MSASEQRESNYGGDDRGKGTLPPAGKSITNQEATEQQTEKTIHKIRTYFKNFASFLIEPKTLLEIAALAVLLCYTRYAGQQSKTLSETLTEIRKQTPEIIESANAANNAATIAALTMRLDQRARLRVRYPPIQMDVGSRLSVPITLENTGKTEARNLTAVIAVSVSEAGAAPNFTYTRGYYAWNSGYLPQGIPDTHNWNALDRKTREDLILTPSVNDAIRSGLQVITINGRIGYDDIFGTHHWLQFCQQGGAPKNGMEISGNKQCAAYNHTDNNQ